MRFPGRSQLPPDPWGSQVTADESRHGIVDDGNVAYAERVEQARRAWPEAKASDFEQIGRRRYRDRGSGIELVAMRGAPLLSIGQEETRGATCFFVQNGRIVVLRPEGYRGAARRAQRPRPRPRNHADKPRSRRRQVLVMGSRRRHKNGITWTEVTRPLPPPLADTIQPLVPAGPAEISMSLYGNAARNEAAARRRKVDQILEDAGVRPKRGW